VEEAKAHIAICKDTKERWRRELNKLRDDLEEVGEILKE
jgi:hypothetical protein